MKGVRVEDGVYIEIDQKKGEYPFMKLEQSPMSDDLWILMVDMNDTPVGADEGDINEVLNIPGRAGMILTEKKMRKLRDFLNELHLGDPLT